MVNVKHLGVIVIIKKGELWVILEWGGSPCPSIIARTKKLARQL